MSKETVLVVGGGGYIGSQAVCDLRDQGYTPIVYDNFSTSNQSIVKVLNVSIVEGDIGDKEKLQACFDQYRPQSVMHFAAFALVGESVLNPLKYYQNNVTATANLLAVMAEKKVTKFIFSSTCATYGIPKQIPITEETEQSPINPYGRTKLIVEELLKECEHAYGIKSVCFRYFNAAGAHPSGLIGERHDPETHIIPLAIFAAQGKGEFSLFGNDYDTSDGTCIRDYIHVADISQAHILGLEYLNKAGKSDVFNIGNGSGYSVKEVLQTVEKVTGNKVPFKVIGRRAGDPPRLIADAKKLISVLGWKPKYPKLEEIVRTAYEWHRKNS